MSISEILPHINCYPIRLGFNASILNILILYNMTEHPIWQSILINANRSRLVIPGICKMLIPGIGNIKYHNRGLVYAKCLFALRGGFIFLWTNRREIPRSGLPWVNSTHTTCRCKTELGHKPNTERNRFRI